MGKFLFKKGSKTYDVKSIQFGECFGKTTNEIIKLILKVKFLIKKA
jgi:hypothetical protein